jgi:acetyl-CoA carboxylase carboxyl transferase subunit alpha
MMDNKKIIKTLEKQLAEFMKMNQSSDMDFSTEIEALKNKIKQLSTPEVVEPEVPSAWKKVQAARDKNRLSTLDYIGGMVDDFIELHGDRLYADDAAIVGGIGFLNGRAVTVIGHQKGKDINDNIKRNFGMPHPEGYRKALRLMKQAEKFNRPILCFIDTPGAYCGLGAEERGQGEAIAKNLIEMAGLKVPVISIVIGEGGSGGALALGVADKVWMLENAIYSVLSPEGFASILWKDASRASEAAGVMKITAEDLHGFNLVDDVVAEPTWTDADSCVTFLDGLKEKIANEFDCLVKLPVDKLCQDRYDKFRSMGVYLR